MAAEKAGKVKDPEVRLAGCLRAILTTTRPEREFPRRFEVPGKCRTRTDTEFLGTLAEREKQQMVLGEFLCWTCLCGRVLSSRSRELSGLNGWEFVFFSLGNWK
ncbi:hypothetical protein DUI87_21800 [Hirundo rustica rustica]|uniref:Uncharacterized protein n=1 Tax=Hirundo rustica rustica TaxID=333673 RepID=A0A3M0JFE8_HIRRU|nr:hypothetical protein DUI87_23938 [Hirundo rustica rustica]RMC01780.1 hypothetical protein DUI87_21800 [Hirundo rustica rustica]